MTPNKSDSGELRRILIDTFDMLGSDEQKRDLEYRKYVIDTAERSVTAHIQADITTIEDKLLDRSIGLDNEETAVKWDDIQEVLAERKRLAQYLGEKDV